MNLTWLRLITIITGLVILGEALALTFGMGVLAPGTNPWVTHKNVLLLGSDIIVGGLLIWVGVSSPHLRLLYGSLTLLLLSHGYREWEYFAGAADQFCFNAPLFILNNVKLLGLLFILLKSISSGF